MGNNKDRHVQGVSATPPVGEVECPPSGYQRPCRCARLAKELGGLRRDLEHHLRARQPVLGVTAKVPTQKPLATLTHGCFRTVVRPCNKPVQRRCVPCADFPHYFRPLSVPRLLGACRPSPCLNRLGAPHTTRRSLSGYRAGRRSGARVGWQADQVGTQLEREQADDAIKRSGTFL